MENKSHALAAGAFVLAVAALLVGLAMWLLRDVANTVAYELASSEAVSGLQPQAPVRFKGVAVGKVTDISFDPTNRANVLVRLAVAADAPVTKSTFATLAYQGVTGLSFVQLDDPGGSSEPLPRGPNGPPRIPLRPNLFGQLSDQAQDLVSKLDTSVERVNALLAPDNQAALIAAVKELGGAAREAAREPDLDDFVGVGDGVVQHAGACPFAGDVAGFFFELAHAADERGFTGVDLAGGELEHDAAHRVAVLALHDEAAVVEDRHHHHGAVVQDVLARGLRAVGQRQRVAAHVEEAALPDLLAADGDLAQVRVLVGHVANARRIAMLHKVIKPPGRMPSSSTAAPLSLAPKMRP